MFACQFSQMSCRCWGREKKKGDAFCSASLPDDYRCGKSLGPVESIQEHPQQAEKILIGYSRGLVILWALSTRQVEQLFLGKQVAGFTICRTKIFQYHKSLLMNILCRF